MKGMDMMVKSVLGIDPAELQAQMQEKITQFQQAAEAFNAKLDVCIANQKMLYALMLDKGIIDSVEDYNARQAAAKEVTPHVNGNC